MHPHFYHWHVHAELKPDTTILEPRWKAAAEFAEEISAADICSLLRLVLFSGGDPEFTKKFSEALVQREPTFPPEGNAELLRVMATATVFSQMEESSSEADAFALGLHAAAFPGQRIQPVCKEVMNRAAEYLGAESERMRQKTSAGAHFNALQDAVEAANWLQNGNATKLLGDGVLELGDVLGRLSEESQFLWWLVGRRSSSLNLRRDKLTPEAYALPAAAEAAERVTLLPPAGSMESLLDEALAQCGVPKRLHAPLVEFIDAAAEEWVKGAVTASTAPDLTPLTGILAVRRAGGKADANTLKQLRIPPKTEASPAEAARQYFHELMFLRALREIS